MATTSRNEATTAGWAAAATADQTIVPIATEQVENSPTFHGLTGRSPVMRQLIAQLQRIAPRLYLGTIEGEEGTGKTLTAHALHAAGPAAAGPFVGCPASRFFNEPQEGHRYGWSKDMMRAAQSGLLLLDGVHQLSAGQQETLAEFLHWLDDSRFAGSRSQNALERPSRSLVPGQEAPAQIVFSSSVELRQTPGRTLFRDDVISRLGAVRFRLPPLSERREDIPLLAQIFIQRFARTYGKTVRGLGPGTIPPLMRYGWPGNVRELENVISAAALETESQWIRPIDLPPFTAGKHEISRENSRTNAYAGAGAESAGDTDWNLDHVIRGHVIRALQRTRGNKLRAAHLLGISRSTLYRILGPDPA
jgi:DNA-binding NtrC family response regulator